MDPVWVEIICTALTVTYATNPYTVLLLPKGNCKMCCPYHPDDIKLYVNIPGGPVEEYLDWQNGSDWRKLDNNRTNVFYIHGFTEQHTGPAAEEMRQAYRERGEENLVVVDWSSLAAAPWYNGAVANTPYVGEFLAGVIDSLVIRGLPLESIHVIGFSLGAEIAGLLAKKITVGKLKRVTGLDPALPLYDPLKPSGRLAKTDAEFVDVIHTDGGIFGFDTPLGHADFFPNGGRPAQPGCRAEILVHTGKLKDFVACSHNRAWKYFAESVRDPYAFPAQECHNFPAFKKGKCKAKGHKAYMGYLADPSLRGKFFLETKDTKPYGLGQHETMHAEFDPSSNVYYTGYQQNDGLGQHETLHTESPNPDPSSSVYYTGHQQHDGLPAEYPATSVGYESGLAGYVPANSLEYSGQLASHPPYSVLEPPSTSVPIYVEQYYPVNNQLLDAVPGAGRSGDYDDYFTDYYMERPYYVDMPFATAGELAYGLPSPPPRPDLFKRRHFRRRSLPERVALPLLARQRALLKRKAAAHGPWNAVGRILL